MGRKSATVLLETLAALALLVGAAVVISVALNSSIQSVERLRLNTHASNLAVSVLSELQLGTKSLVSGPQPCDSPYEEWTWETVVTADQNLASTNSAFSQVEVVVRHETPPIVYRLAQRIQIPPAGSFTESATTTTTTVP